MDIVTVALIIGIIVVAAGVFVVVLRALISDSRREPRVVPGFSERTLRVIREQR